MTSARQLLLSCATSYLLASSSAGAESATELSTDIPPQSLTHALTALAQQTGLQLIYVSAVAGTQQSQGAQAGLSVSEALTRLLEGTGLQFEFLNARTVKIYAPPNPAQPISRSASPSEHHAARQPAAQALALEEVVVTATRREDRASNVPISMMVWSQEAMEASGVKGIDEIGLLTPGVEFDWDSGIGPGVLTSLVIRGVTERRGPTTGVYIDDTPVPIADSYTLGRSFPWAFDLDRVEVLRGPQGTLLGQATLGGAVRFIMNQPSLTTSTGFARTEVAMTARGGATSEAGFAAGGPLITNVLGFRVSGWYQREGGFVDRINPFNGATVEDYANRGTNRSARGALTWALTESVHITPSLDYESYGIHDSPNFWVSRSNPKAGELKNGSLVQQPFGHVFYLASVKLNAGFNIADVNADTAYFHRTAQVVIDWALPTSGPPVSPADALALPVDFTQRVFSQEIRLTSAKTANAAISWIAGAFYSSERTRQASWLVSAGGAEQDPRTSVVHQSQLDGFGQIGLQMTQRLTASGGLRIGRTVSDVVTEAPPISRASVTETSVTPRFELFYHSDAGSLWYLTAAKGYRSGGFNPALAGCATTPDENFPDTVWSYEIGAKRDLLAGRVHVEPSLFHIQWHNQQQAPVVFYQCGGASSGGAAASNGFDLAAQVLVTERVKLGLALAYTDARYTQTLKAGDAVIVRKGDVLGSFGFGGAVSPWNITTSIEYQAALTPGVAIDLRAEDTFHSRSPGPFVWDNPGSPFYAPGLPPDASTNVLNLRARLRWPSLDVTLFANNALDAQPTLGYNGLTARTFRPRTVGLSATWRFERLPHGD